MGSFLSGIRSAFGFLTRIPVGAIDPADLAKAPRWFPLVGTFVGLCVAGVYALTEPVVGQTLGATIAVTVGVLLTGAFHEDGLADTADAFGSGATGERAVEIMRDSRLGTYGTVALVIAIIWKVAAVASMSPQAALAWIVAAAAMGRAVVLVMMRAVPPGTSDGGGRQMVLALGSGSLWFGVITAVIVGSVLVGVWILAAVVAVAAVFLWFKRTTMSKLGGVTGDVLGALEQVSELAVLTVGVGVFLAGLDLWWT